MFLEAWQPCELRGRWTRQNEFAKGSFGGEETSQNADCRMQSAGMTSAGEIADCRMQMRSRPERSQDAARMQNAECECGCQGVMGAREENAKCRIQGEARGLRKCTSEK